MTQLDYPIDIYIPHKYGGRVDAVRAKLPKLCKVHVLDSEYHSMPLIKAGTMGADTWLSENFESNRRELSTLIEEACKGEN